MSEKLKINPIKLKRNPKEKFSLYNYKISIINNDTNLTEKIIAKNIQFKNLFYSLQIIQLDLLNNIIKNNFFPSIYYVNNPIIINKLYKPSEKFFIELPSNLNLDYIYKINVNLIEKINNIENIILKSNIIFFNLRIGEITEKTLNKLHKERYEKKIYSKSEKDNIKNIKNEVLINNLDNFLDEKEIEKFTFENRYYSNIKNFVNSNYKVSKLMTENRKKKVLFRTTTENFFDNKIDLNNLDNKNNIKNPFLKNEWFMGPIYSYDNNYEKLI
jgi:hypothetical protein